MTDTLIANLVRQAQAGNNSAFNQLVEYFEGIIFAVVMRRLRNTAEASEITQDVFLRAYRKLPQLREPERFAGWLKRIAIRLSINRAVRRPRESMQDPDFFGGFVDDGPENPVRETMRVEEAHQVRDGISQLRDLDRETLEAFYFEGQSLREMSDRFSSPIGTIKRRLHTARSRLKTVLSDMQPAC